MAVADQFGAQPSEQGLLRVVHGSPDAPAVDVGVLNTEKKVAPVLVSDLTFGTSSEAAGLAISPAPRRSASPPQARRIRSRRSTWA